MDNHWYFGGIICYATERVYHPAKKKRKEERKPQSYRYRTHSKQTLPSPLLAEHPRSHTTRAQPTQRTSPSSPPAPPGTSTPRSQSSQQSTSCVTATGAGRRGVECENSDQNIPAVVLTAAAATALHEAGEDVFAAENSFVRVYWCTTSSFGRVLVRFSVLPEIDAEGWIEVDEERLRLFVFVAIGNCVVVGAYGV